MAMAMVEGEGEAMAIDVRHLPGPVTVGIFKL